MHGVLWCSRAVGLALALTLTFRFLLGAAPAAAQEAAPQTIPIMAALRGDAIPPEPPPWVETVPAAAAAEDEDPAPGFLETSEYMIGSVAVGVIFLESNGAIDPSTEDWTPAQQGFAMQKLQAALDWWAAQNTAARLSFVVERAETSVPISYEPITRTGSDGPDKALWMSEAMEKKGFPASKFAQWRNRAYQGQAFDYVNDLRDRKGTDWAFVVFFVNDANDPDHAFADGPEGLSFAALSGPYLVALYTNGNWGADRLNLVLAHEMGHIFGATDTYDSKQQSSGYFNTPDVDGRTGLMNKNDLFLPEDTRLQIGWRDSDGDGILDPLDTQPRVELVPQDPDPTDLSALTLRGRALEVPLPNKNPYNHRSVSLNSIRSVDYRLDGGAWRSATAADGAFDAGIESFTLPLANLGTGQHQVEVRAANTIGNAAAEPAADAFLVTHIVVTEASVSAERASTGSTQEVRLRLAWAHNGSPVPSGTVSLSGGTPVAISPSGQAAIPVTSDAVGRTTWTAQARSGAIQKTVSQGEAPAIVWDRVQVTELSVSDDRADAGTEQAIMARALLEYDSTPLGPGDLLSINGTPALWDPAARAFRTTHRQAEVGAVTFKVTAVEQRTYKIVSLRDTAGPKAIVWDRVQVTELSVSDDRADAGTEQAIMARALLEYDGTPLGPGDLLSINGTPAAWDPAARAFRTTHRQAEVGAVTFKVTAAEQRTYKIASLRDTAGAKAVVWDRVQVTLDAPRRRIDVGSEAPLVIAAAYESDGQRFDGQVVLNAPLRREEVGLQELAAMEVRGSRYGITQFVTNQVPVVWDQVAVTVQPALERVEAGTAARLEWTGSYAYDGAPFGGEVAWDTPLLQTALGRQEYRVARVEDPLYGLQAFTANEAAVTFDRIQTQVQLGPWRPGRLMVTVSTQYATDQAPATGMEGSVSGGALTSIQPGLYTGSVGAWLPWASYDLTLQKEGFTPFTLRERAVLWGNGLLLALGMLAVAALGAWALRRRRAA